MTIDIYMMFIYLDCLQAYPLPVAVKLTIDFCDACIVIVRPTMPRTTVLINSGWDKMAVILQTTFWNAFASMEKLNLYTCHLTWMT